MTTVQIIFVATLCVGVFMPLVLMILKSEPPYNPHSPYWKRKNRSRGR